MAKEKDAKVAETSGTPATDATKPAAAPPPPPLTPSQEIQANAALIERAVATLEPRFTTRVLRGLTTLRKKLKGEGVKEFREGVAAVYGKDVASKNAVFAYIVGGSTESGDASMQIDSAPTTTTTATTAPPTAPCPETEVYLRLLTILHLIDVSDLTRAKELARETAEKIQFLNRRSMDALAAKVYFYLSRVWEMDNGGKGDLAELRPLLLAAQRTAALRHDAELEATLINLLLRSYIQHNLYSQADKLVSKTHLPESAGNPQLARYLYYLGRIRAVQLSYTESHTHLQQAIRRAPAATLAPGFYQTVHKLFLVVELLMGDIPDRALFRHPVLQSALEPYLQIVQAVRTGDLAQFTTSLQTHTPQFAADGTYTLILRLRHNVIKTGVRALSIAYSRISLRDICVKLHLDSEEDAEYIVGKAVRDGVIDARVDHTKGWMESGRQGGKDVYETGEPREAFGKRIGFCLELHNESVKAMRYPLNTHRKDLATAAEATKREKELAKEIEEGEHDDDDEDGPGSLPDF